MTELPAAIEPILSSRAFRRADQLKRLLSYLATHAQATEYELGVQALGRPASFTPETDSSVRTRIHALRQKLDEYYADEGAADSLRVHLPKGAYSLELIAPEPSQPPSAKTRWPLVIAALALAAAALAWTTRAQPTALDTFWQPFLQSKTPVAILVGQPVHLWVRDMQRHENAELYPPFPDPLPASPEFRRYLANRLPNPGRLVLHPSPNAVLWGDAAGAATASRFLAFRQANSELVPESTLRGEIALRGRPVVAFGRPEFSPAVGRYLALAGGYTVGFIDNTKEWAIHRGGTVYRNTAPPDEVNYGLVTVLDEGGARVCVFSGITSDGSTAGLDFFTSADSLRQLQQRLAAQGHAEWPRVFQVVVRTVSSIGYSMGATYETHVVLKR